jgi:hypothetical protein
MNYQNFASYSNVPPYYGKEKRAHYDRGSGVPPITKDNMTIQDIFRTPFLFLNDHHKDYKSTVNETINNISCSSGLHRMFFSDKNTRRIQDKLKRAIYEKTNGQFKSEDQDPRDIDIIMKAVYKEHARFTETGLVREIKRLNQQLVDDTLPGMITNIKQYYGYLKDINSPIKPIPRPLNMSSKGRRILPSITTIFH